MLEEFFSHDIDFKLLKSFSKIIFFLFFEGSIVGRSTIKLDKNNGIK